MTAVNHYCLGPLAVGGPPAVSYSEHLRDSSITRPSLDSLETHATRVARKVKRGSVKFHHKIQSRVGRSGIGPLSRCWAG